MRRQQLRGRPKRQLRGSTEPHGQSVACHRVLVSRRPLLAAAQRARSRLPRAIVARRGALDAARPVHSLLHGAHPRLLLVGRRPISIAAGITTRGRAGSKAGGHSRWRAS